jgi:hypothetical protein
MSDDERDDGGTERDDPPTEPLRPSGGSGRAGSSDSDPVEPSQQPGQGISEHEDLLWSESVRRVPRSARRQKDADAGEGSAGKPPEPEDLHDPPLFEPEPKASSAAPRDPNPPASGASLFDQQPPAGRERTSRRLRVPRSTAAAREAPAPPRDSPAPAREAPSAGRGGGAPEQAGAAGGTRPKLTGAANDWDQARAWAGTTSWAFRGALILLIAVIVMLIVPAQGSTQYKSASGFTSLAGFAFMAAALERIGEFALAPWWGKVSTKRVTKALSTARALHVAQARLAGSPPPVAAPAGAPPVQPSVIPAKVGVTGAAILRASAHRTHTAAINAEAAAPSRDLADDQVKELASASHAATSAAKTASEAADDLWVQATKQRPTILLPMAAAAAVICYCLHLFLLHSLARNGVSNTHLAYIIDALITGFAVAGGAQPFHDLVTGLTASTAAKKATGGAPSTGT